MRARAHSGLRLLRWCGVGALGLVFSVGIPTNIAHAQFGAMVPDQRPIPIEAFYEVLRDYGTWLDTDRYGTVFCPHPDVIGVDFQPYARGHWTMSSEGWTFVSPHKISWATDHYGRWVEVALTNCTWAWLPGSDWSPAWVEFRVSDRVVAWRPKPYGGPPVHMQLPYGVRLPQVSLPPSTFSTDGRDAGFVAVPDNDFTSRRLENVTLSGAQLYAALRETEPLTNPRAGLHSAEREAIAARIEARREALAGTGSGTGTGSGGTRAGGQPGTGPGLGGQPPDPARRRKPGSTVPAGPAGAAGTVRAGLPGPEVPPPGREKNVPIGTQPASPPGRNDGTTGISPGNPGTFSGAKLLDWGKPKQPTPLQKSLKPGAKPENTDEKTPPASR